MAPKMDTMIPVMNQVSKASVFVGRVGKSRVKMKVLQFSKHQRTLDSKGNDECGRQQKLHQLLTFN